MSEADRSYCRYCLRMAYRIGGTVWVHEHSGHVLCEPPRTRDNKSAKPVPSLVLTSVDERRR